MIIPALRWALSVVGLLGSAGAGLIAGTLLPYCFPSRAESIARSTYLRLYPIIVKSGLRLGTRPRLPGIAAPQAVRLPPDELSANRFSVTTRQDGLTGTFLFAMKSPQPGFPHRVVEVDRAGRVIWEYRPSHGRRLSGEVRKLATGHVVLVETPSLAEDRDRRLPGWQGIPNTIVEVDRAGTVVRRIDACVTHQAEMLPSGNFLTVDVIDNAVRELDPSGNEVWKWDAHNHIRRYDERTYVGHAKRDVTSLSLRNMYHEFREKTGPVVPVHVMSEN